MDRLIAFAVRALAACEMHCKLVSNSAMLRVDLGVEILFVDKENKQTEDDLLREQKKMWLWIASATDAGFICRPFVNEVRLQRSGRPARGQHSGALLHRIGRAAARDHRQRMAIAAHSLLTRLLPWPGPADAYIYVRARAALLLF